MSSPCNTIKIKATTGSYPYSVINESDFDAAKHEVYVETEDTKKAGDMTLTDAGKHIKRSGKETK